MEYKEEIENKMIEAMMIIKKARLSLDDSNFKSYWMFIDIEDSIEAAISEYHHETNHSE